MIPALVQSGLNDLRQLAGEDKWLINACEIAQDELGNLRHGDLPRWCRALANLPPCKQQACLDLPAPLLGPRVADPERLREVLMELHPWRKGPLCLGGLEIDTEWRSDWKWNRIAPHLDLDGGSVLDIGCGNGYFGWRMLGAGADLVVGIDPTLVFVMQWAASRHFAGDLANFVLPLKVQQLAAGQNSFDWVFSMGVLYHRRDHMAHLQRILSLLQPNGTLVLETLVLPNDNRATMLVPSSRYARMRNVWAVPATGEVMKWLVAAGFGEAHLLDVTPTTGEEQRTTEWMRFDSLERSLDSDNPHLTVEGHPAPRRAIFLARR